MPCVFASQYKILNLWYAFFCILFDFLHLNHSTNVLALWHACGVFFSSLDENRKTNLCLTLGKLNWKLNKFFFVIYIIRNVNCETDNSLKQTFIFRQKMQQQSSTKIAGASVINPYFYTHLVVFIKFLISCRIFFSLFFFHISFSFYLVFNPVWYQAHAIKTYINTLSPSDTIHVIFV